MRREYCRNGLRRRDLAADPFVQFEQWFSQAVEGGIVEPNAMSLATVDATTMQPSLRTVLLKMFDQRGFVFFTNYTSAKARQIAGNPRVALLFPWVELGRQVQIRGRAEKISQSSSLKYFLSRPRGARLGAWVSPQSSVIGSRQLLEMKLAEMKKKFSRGEVPLPDFWGGFLVVPESFEFWQGREHRLHDRFLYTPESTGSWLIRRLAP
jgi:pyridoxamine 5'-phosphate oxidase